MTGPFKDWGAVLDRLLRGDEVAFLDMTRLVTLFLVQWRAYDFRDEWDDLIQEVILATVTAGRSGQIRRPEAVRSYVRSVSRFKFVDWLRRRRCEPLPEEDAPPRPLEWPPREDVPEEALDVRSAVRKLPEKHQKAILGVYGEGKTYECVAEETGIPLGSLKRYLREGLATLRETLSPRDRDPKKFPDTTRVPMGRSAR